MSLTAQKPIIHVQYCTNCGSHNWNTHHNEAKYHQTFLKLKKTIEFEFRNLQIIVIANKVPSYLIAIKQQQNKFYNPITKKYVFYPNVGSFQILLNEELLFSKKTTNNWPCFQTLLNDLSLRLLHQPRVVEQNHKQIQNNQTKQLLNKGKKQIQNEKINNSNYSHFQQQDKIIQYRTNYLTDEKQTPKKFGNFSLTDHFKNYHKVQNFDSNTTIKQGNQPQQQQKFNNDIYSKQKVKNNENEYKIQSNQQEIRQNQYQIEQNEYKSNQYQQTKNKNEQKVNKIEYKIESMQGLKKALSSSNKSISSSSYITYNLNQNMNRKQILINLSSIEQEYPKVRSTKNQLNGILKQQMSVNINSLNNEKSLSIKRLQEWGHDLKMIQKKIKKIQIRVKGDQQHNQFNQQLQSSSRVENLKCLKNTTKRQNKKNKNTIIQSSQQDTDLSRQEIAPSRQDTNYLKMLLNDISQSKNSERYQSNEENKNLKSKKLQQIQAYLKSNNDQKNKKLKRIYGDWNLSPKQKKSIKREYPTLNIYSQSSSSQQMRQPSQSLTKNKFVIKAQLKKSLSTNIKPLKQTLDNINKSLSKNHQNNDFLVKAQAASFNMNRKSYRQGKKNNHINNQTSNDIEKDQYQRISQSKNGVRKNFMVKNYPKNNISSQPSLLLKKKGHPSASFTHHNSDKFISKDTKFDVQKQMKNQITQQEQSKQQIYENKNKNKNKGKQNTKYSKQNLSRSRMNLCPNQMNLSIKSSRIHQIKCLNTQNETQQFIQPIANNQQVKINKQIEDNSQLKINQQIDPNNINIQTEKIIKKSQIVHLNNLDLKINTFQDNSLLQHSQQQVNIMIDYSPQKQIAYIMRKSIHESIRKSRLFDQHDSQRSKVQIFQNSKRLQKSNINKSQHTNRSYNKVPHLLLQQSSPMKNGNNNILKKSLSFYEQNNQSESCREHRLSPSSSLQLCKCTQRYTMSIQQNQTKRINLEQIIKEKHLKKQQKLNDARQRRQLLQRQKQLVIRQKIQSQNLKQSSRLQKKQSVQKQRQQKKLSKLQKQKQRQQQRLQNFKLYEKRRLQMQDIFRQKNQKQNKFARTTSLNTQPIGRSFPKLNQNYKQKSENKTKSNIKQQIKSIRKSDKQDLQLKKDKSKSQLKNQTYPIADTNKNRKSHTRNSYFKQQKQSQAHKSINAKLNEIDQFNAQYKSQQNSQTDSNQIYGMSAKTKNQRNMQTQTISKSLDRKSIDRKSDRNSIVEQAKSVDEKIRKSASANKQQKKQIIKSVKKSVKYQNDNSQKASNKASTIINKSMNIFQEQSQQQKKQIKQLQKEQNIQKQKEEQIQQQKEQQILNDLTNCKQLEIKDSKCLKISVVNDKQRFQKSKVSKALVRNKVQVPIKVSRKSQYTKLNSNSRQKRSQQLIKKSIKSTIDQKNIFYQRIPAGIIDQLYGMQKQTLQQNKHYQQLFENNMVLQKKPCQFSAQKQIAQQFTKFICISQIFQNSSLFFTNSIEHLKIKSNSSRSQNFLKTVTILAERNELLLVRLFQDYKIELKKSHKEAYRTQNMGKSNGINKIKNAIDQKTINQQMIDESEINNKKPIKRSFYGVWICLNHKWKCIVVNNLIPVKSIGVIQDIKSTDPSQYEPQFAMHTGAQLWPIILEKALAIAVGGYNKLSALSVGQIFSMLTGSNHLTYAISQNNSKNKAFLRSISDYEKKNFIMICQRYSSNIKQFNQMHASCDVKLHYIHSKKTVEKAEQSYVFKQETLLKMSSMSVMDGIKQQNGINEPYYIKYEKFCETFKTCEVLQLRQHHNFCSMQLQVGKAQRTQQKLLNISKDNSGFNIVQLTFEESSFGTITIFNEHKGDLKTYLYKLEAGDNQIMKLVGQASKNNKQELFFDCYFQQKKYYLFVQQSQTLPSRISYMGENRPSLQIKQQILQKGLKNNLIQYLPINNYHKFEQSNKMRSSQINNFSGGMSFLNGTRIKDKTMDKTHQLQSMDQLREIFVQLMLKDRKRS